MELVEFYNRIPQKETLSSGQLIPYFLYFLHKDIDFVSANKIQKCFEQLKIKAYSNISLWLQNNSKGKNAKIIKGKNGYTLDRNNINIIALELKDEIAGDVAINEITANKVTTNEVCNVISKKIFIVHGHDNLAKEQVARVIEKAGFEAVILHEQASGGRTIIEKIEKYSEVSYAVVLYTPCDIGCDKNSNNYRNRARQNVVFEHGYLIGKLGRERVCALVKDKVETPGDISGVVYVQMDDAGAWKMSLAKEMELAGIQIDYSKIV